MKFRFNLLGLTTLGLGLNLTIAIANRFVISNLSSAESFHTTVLSSLGGNSVSSNSIIIPSIL